MELLASYWTIACGAQPHTDHEYSAVDFEVRVAAAARAGFTGMGLWHADLVHTLERLSLRDMRRILDDHGMRHLELEFLADWFLDGERRAQSDRRRQLLLEAAATLGAHHVKVGDFFKERTPMPRLIEEYARLCTDAATHGTRAAFELMPFAMIDTVEAALELVRGANAANGGLIIDLWHIVKLGIPYTAVAAIPARYLHGVELNDGYLHPPPQWTLHEETINHRQLCGDGEFDVRGFVACMLGAGYTGPWGIEVLSERLRYQAIDAVCHRAYRTTRAQFPA
jgi:sugar phosphate isomerase/epimerase